MGSEPSHRSTPPEAKYLVGPAAKGRGNDTAYPLQGCHHDRARPSPWSWLLLLVSVCRLVSLRLQQPKVVALGAGAR
eukprot:768262-Hanusia_phi.AAC.2